MAIVSISYAAKLVRKGRQTLYNHNDKGKLSFTQTEDGKPGIDTSELERVYGKLYMPADKVETVIQDSSEKSDRPGQANIDRPVYPDSAHSKVSKPVSDVQSTVSNTVSMDNDTASTLSWFMEQVDEAKEELAATQAELADRDKSLAELRKAMAALPSPETVEQRLAEQAEHLKQQHTNALQVEREQQAKLLAEHKQREAQHAEQWQQSIADRKLEIQQARTQAEEFRQRERRQAEALKIEQSRVEALESRGFFDRLLNRKPSLADS